MATFSFMLEQLVTDQSVKHKVEQFKQQILDEKKTGALIVVDGQPATLETAFIAQQAVDLLNETSVQSYICMTYFLDDEIYNGVPKDEVIAQLTLKQPILLNIEEALEELVLEAEYSYKKIGMSKHMSFNVKQQFRKTLAIQTAEMIAMDMNLLFVRTT